MDFATIYGTNDSSVKKMRRKDYAAQALHHVLCGHIVLLSLFGMLLFAINQFDAAVYIGTFVLSLVLVLVFGWTQLVEQRLRGKVLDIDGEVLYHGDHVLLFSKFNGMYSLRHYATILSGVQPKPGHVVVRVLGITNEFTKSWPLDCIRLAPRTPTDKDQLALEFEAELHDDGYYYIPGPGKFEGEPLWVAYYYHLMLSGAADGEIGDGESEPALAYFEVTEDDKVLWPELEDENYIGIWQRDDGFVMAERTAAVEYLLKEDGVLETP